MAAVVLALSPLPLPHHFYLLPSLDLPRTQAGDLSLPTLLLTCCVLSHAMPCGVVNFCMREGEAEHGACVPCPFCDLACPQIKSWHGVCDTFYTAAPNAFFPFPPINEAVTTKLAQAGWDILSHAVRFLRAGWLAGTGTSCAIHDF